MASEPTLLKEAQLRGAMAAAAASGSAFQALQGVVGVLGKALNDVNTMAQGALTSKQAADAALSAIAQGYESSLPGYRSVSRIDDLLFGERAAGKAASIDYVKANPECPEKEAIWAWIEAATKLTGLPRPIQDPVVLALVYRANLVSAGLIPEPTWEAQRAWIVATDKATIMGA